MSSVPESTEVLTDPKAVMARALQVFSNAKTAVDILAETVVPAEPIQSGDSKRTAEVYYDVKKRGGRLRILTRIDEKNVQYAKEIVKNVELRHLDDIRGNFAVTDSEFMSAPSATSFQPNEMVTVIYSNARPFVEQNRNAFERLWNRAEPAEQRINEIEQGVAPPKIEIIRDPREIKKTYLDLIALAKKEILLIVPTSGAFHREETVGVVGALTTAATSRGVKVSIITPNSMIEETLRALGKSIEQGVGLKMVDHRRILEATTPNTVTVLVIDRNSSLVIEQRDDSQPDFEKAIGVATYSTRNSTVLANIRFFERVWEEVGLREREEAMLESERRSRETAELLQDILSHDIRNYDQISRTSAEMLGTSLAGNAKAVGDAIAIIDSVTKESGALAEKARIVRAELTGNLKNLSDANDLIGEIVKATEASSDLINKTKQLGRIVSQETVPLKSIDLESSIRKSISLVKAANPKRRIDVSLTAEPGARVLADEMLEEAFTNVLSNSVNYTEGDAVPVEIRVEEGSLEGKPKKFWKIVFTDRGRGIPDTLKSNIFTRYQKTASGTGLGLSIVHALGAERYAGEVKVRDRVEGDYTKGTVIEIWLPSA